MKSRSPGRRRILPAGTAAKDVKKRARIEYVPNSERRARNWRKFWTKPTRPRQYFSREKWGRGQGKRTSTELEDRDKQQVEDKRPLAAEAVAEDAEEDGANRAEEKGEGDGLRLHPIRNC